MTKEEKYRLLRLYELLWEEIKDRACRPLNLETEFLSDMGIISIEEERMLDHHMIFSMDDNMYNSSQRKSFVLEQIEKLKKEV